MKIDYLIISNVLSFAYYEDILQALCISFDEGINIVIGENGAGKSTALEVLNFILKRVMYRQYNFNHDLFDRRASLPLVERRQILRLSDNSALSEFRLNPNWATENLPQRIRLRLKLDAVDLHNLDYLTAISDKLRPMFAGYTESGELMADEFSNNYTFDIELFHEKNNFVSSLSEGNQDFGYRYLTDYNCFRELIHVYNTINSDNPIGQISESFTLISGYRNYSSFNSSVSLKEQHAALQIYNIKNQEYVRSMNAADQREPSIFNVVRLRVAEIHFELISTNLSENECERKANELPFIRAINEKLRIVNLRCVIKLIDKRTWQYKFDFFDFKRNRFVADVNSLSAGQKAIIHLVFEAYGRDELQGGVTIIDEPEIHLHYQFQHEYLQVIRILKEQNKGQYILVTHSEALIDSTTISQVRRFALNAHGHTEIRSPVLSIDQRGLIKILDNTRSIYAFFSKKVILVEGDSDRYFYRSVILEMYPELDREVAVLFMGGRGGYDNWSALFRDFGLSVYFIGDLDVLAKRFYPAEKGTKLADQTSVRAFKIRNPDWKENIDIAKSQNIYILQNGDLEYYLRISKGLDRVIEFCNSSLSTYLSDDANACSIEIREFIAEILKK
jgi:predicted ATP-dependent endonuclease of OLD family